ncbi:MAG: hypothetical protein ABSC48_14650 [Terracidiphilus sp.]
MSFVDFELGMDDAVDRGLLTAPEKKVYGGGPNEISQKRIRVRLGERPTARNLRLLLESAGQTLPPNLSVYKGYNIWIINLSVGIVKEGGWQDVTQLGLHAELPTQPRFTVLSLLPETRLIQKLKTGFKCQAHVEANGMAKIPDLAESFVGAPVSASGKAVVEAAASIGWDLSFSVLTPVVTAIGKGDRRAEWLLEAGDEPLIGDQDLMFTLLAPLTADEVSLTARVQATISTFDFLPVVLRGREVELQVDLT